MNIIKGVTKIHDFQKYVFAATQQFLKKSNKGIFVTRNCTMISLEIFVTRNCTKCTKHQTPPDPIISKIPKSNMAAIKEDHQQQQRECHESQQQKISDTDIKYALHRDLNGKRIVTLAYRIAATDVDEKTATTKTTLDYGAAIFQVENNQGKKDVWSKSLRRAHRVTAEERLMYPVRVTFTAPIKKIDEEMSAAERAKDGKAAYRQFVGSLRDQLHRHGVTSKKPRQNVPAQGPNVDKCEVVVSQ